MARPWSELRKRRVGEPVRNVGDLIENRYRVLSVLGAGSVGVVYRVADEPRDGAVVALKILQVLESVPDTVEDFRREFRTLTQLRHPNLVSVYDYGVTEAGDLYFTMEYVEGRTLRQVVREAGTGVLVPLMVQVCRALAYIHSRGILHGDLKPSNVLVVAGQVKLLDFGLSLEQRVALPRRYESGTPGYTAPEVRLRQVVDLRADLYSLGAMWYELLTGELALAAEVEERLVLERLEQALAAQAEAPAELGPVVARLLAYSADGRYVSANAVIAAVNVAAGTDYALETRETAASYALQGRFVGRRAELEALRQAWQQVQAGDGPVLMVSGERGVGKTRLLQELAVQVALAGARVAVGRCTEAGGGPYHPWREVLPVLVRYVEEGDPATARRLGPVLATVLPELRSRGYLVDAAPPSVLDAPAAQARLNDAIAQMVRAAAALRPTLLVIEDVHWADEATLDLLRFLAKASALSRLLLCVSCRQEEEGTVRVLDALSVGRTVEIRLRNLDPDATADLVQSMLGLGELPGPLADRVQRTTAGNTYFVQELVRSLAEDDVVLQRTSMGWRVDERALRQAALPHTIQQAVAQRLERLPAPERSVLQWAAVVGPVFWDGAVQLVSGARREDVHEALQALQARGMVHERDVVAFAGMREYAFEHDVLREFTYESIPESQRPAIHVRAAEWLVACSGDREGEYVGRIGEHLYLAGEAARAIGYLRRAGEQAASQFANAEAAHYFSRALELIPEGQVAERYALLLAREAVNGLSGEWEAQRQDLAALHDLVEALEDDRRRAEVSLRQSRYHQLTGDYPAALAAVQEADRLIEMIGEISWRAAVCLEWGGILWRQGSYEEAERRLTTGLDLAAKAGERELQADTLRALGNVRWSEAPRYYDRALQIYREIGHPGGAGASLNNLGAFYAYRGDYARARACYEQALPIQREIGNRWGECVVLLNLSLLSHNLNDDDTAREYGEQALLISQQTGDRVGESYALTFLGHALYGSGSLLEAAALYERAADLRRALGANALLAESLAGMARVALARADAQRAQAILEEILRLMETTDLAEGADEPFLVRWVCYQVLRANQDPRADAFLCASYDLLQQTAARVDDEDLRRSFLENVAAHRQIVSAFNERQGV